MSKELPGLFRYHSPNIPMAAIRRHARRIAEKFDEMRGATSLGENKPPLNDLICFHCQQSAEKYLKALLQEWGLVPPRIHDLVKLLSLLLPHDATLRSLRRKLASLSNYAVDYRYPGDNASKKQALTALRHAESVRKAIRARLALPP
jgi:HEPN domain-containing protein